MKRTKFCLLLMAALRVLRSPGWRYHQSPHSLCGMPFTSDITGPRAQSRILDRCSKVRSIA